MTHGSLFSGIGGFDLAAEWMGWENKFHCENNPFGQKVLNYYWPQAELFEDIKKADFKKYNGTIDIISGGFPCQPYSAAGKRLGTADDRHLWPEMLRVVREVCPGWVVGENVRGITNWNGGLVFDAVQADLEAEGYKVLPFLLPACAINAPHRRDRIWFVAYNKSQRCGEKRANFGRQKKWYTGNGNERVTSNADGNGYELRGFGEDRFTSGESEGQQNKWERLRGDDRGTREQKITTDSKSERRSGRQNDTNFKERKPAAGEQTRDDIRGEYCGPGNEQYASNPKGRGLPQRDAEQLGGEKSYPNDKQFSSIREWENFPTQPPVRCRDDGFSSKLVGFTFSRHRNESIKGYGNAIVPQVAFQIFKAIQEYENSLKGKK